VYTKSVPKRTVHKFKLKLEGFYCTVESIVMLLGTIKAIIGYIRIWKGGITLEPFGQLHKIDV